MDDRGGAFSGSYHYAMNYLRMQNLREEEEKLGSGRMFACYVVSFNIYGLEFTGWGSARADRHGQRITVVRSIVVRWVMLFMYIKVGRF